MVLVVFFGPCSTLKPFDGIQHRGPGLALNVIVRFGVQGLGFRASIKRIRCWGLQ